MKDQTFTIRRSHSFHFLLILSHMNFYNLLRIISNILRSTKICKLIMRKVWIFEGKWFRWLSVWFTREMIGYLLTFLIATDGTLKYHHIKKKDYWLRRTKLSCSELSPFKPFPFQFLGYSSYEFFLYLNIFNKISSIYRIIHDFRNRANSYENNRAKETLFSCYSELVLLIVVLKDSC